jgi:hypothetical protein
MEVEQGQTHRQSTDTGRVDPRPCSFVEGKRMRPDQLVVGNQRWRERRAIFRRPDEQIRPAEAAARPAVVHVLSAFALVHRQSFRSAHRPRPTAVPDLSAA